jgi:FkbM family methyltransferase
MASDRRDDRGGNVGERLRIALARSPKAYQLARRPYGLGRYLLRRPHEAAYAAFKLFPDRTGLFLDVGANAGMSAYSFRIFRAGNPILSIEPNPFHEGDLRFVGRIVRRFDYRICAAGAEHQRLTLHVPVFNGVPLTTEASLLAEEVWGSHSLRRRLGPRMDGARFAVVEREVRVVPLDDMQLEPSFVKLDVQGFETEALLGLLRTIERARPVIMVETPSSETRDLLDAREYAAHTYDDGQGALVAETPGTTNVLFVPTDRRVA